MSNVVELPRQQKLPDDLPELLRKLADRVEAGTVTDMVVAYVEDDHYEYLWPSPLDDSLIICTLAQARAIDRYRR